MSNNNGRVVWHDCMTPDVDKSIEFYTKLFGWTIETWDPSPSGVPYPMIKNGEESLGGFVKLDGGTELPPHWISYVHVDDIDAALQRTAANGGKVCVPATEIPTVGKFSVIEDPTGGYISPFCGQNEPGPEPENGPPVGNFIWEELLTSDPVKAAGFYGEVFGWATEEMDMGENGIYRVQKRGDVPEAGIMQKPPDAPGPSHWLSYVRVDDVDAAAARAVELGGRTFVEPMDVPSIGRMSVHADSVGGMFAVYKPAAHE